jgi:hypothetical protein
VFENRVLRRIFGSDREEVAGGCRRLYNEERHSLYALPNIIMVIKLEDEMDKTCSTHGGWRSLYKILFTKLKEKRPLRRPWCRWECNIGIDLREIC